MQYNGHVGPNFWPNVDYFVLFYKETTDYYRTYEALNDLLKSEPAVLKRWGTKGLICTGSACGPATVRCTLLPVRDNDVLLMLGGSARASV
jgi:hypothetical protein